jgi:hypothetical protein
MTRPRATTGRLALALLVALAPASRAAAPPAAPRDAPGPGPLFDAREPHANPLHLAVAVVGATPPPAGPCASLGALLAGESVKAWSLEGAMTNRYSRVSLGAGTLVLSGFDGPFAGLGALVAGQQHDCWALIDTDRFRPLPAEWLEAVSDGRGIPVGGLEAEMYARVLLRANFTSAKAFRGAVRTDVTYNHVFEDPARYRGVVVRVEGRLLRVNRYDPPFEAAEAGVNDVYEAWVFNEQLGANPYCVIFTEWPADLPRDLLGVPKIERPIRVALDGYFFKKFRYKSNDRRSSERDAPLVIGHALFVVSKGSVGRSPESAAWLNTMLWVFAGVVAALIAGVVGLTYWYRRSDSRVRRRIMARMPEFALPPPDVPPVAAPVARPVRVPERPASPPARTQITARRGNPPSTNGGEKEHPPDEGAGA